MTPGVLPLRLPCQWTYGLPHPLDQRGAAAPEPAAQPAPATTAALLLAHELAAALGEQEHQLARRAERVRDGVEVGQRKSGPQASADLGDEDVARGHPSESSSASRSIAGSSSGRASRMTSSGVDMSVIFALRRPRHIGRMERVRGRWALVGARGALTG